MSGEIVNALHYNEDPAGIREVASQLNRGHQVYYVASFLTRVAFELEKALAAQRALKGALADQASNTEAHRKSADEWATRAIQATGEREQWKATAAELNRLIRESAPKPRIVDASTATVTVVTFRCPWDERFTWIGRVDAVQELLGAGRVTRVDIEAGQGSDEGRAVVRMVFNRPLSPAPASDPCQSSTPRSATT